MKDKAEPEAETSIIRDTSLAERIREWKGAPNWLLVLATLSLVFVSTSDTLVAKLQTRQYVRRTPGAEKLELFEGPLWQTFVSYILEACMIFVYLWDSKKAKAKGKKYHSELVHMHSHVASFTKGHCPIWYWAVPAFLDFCVSYAVNFGVVYLRASTVQLLRNLNVIATAVLSLFVIRIAIRINQIIGIVVLTAGLVVIALQAIDTQEENRDTKDTAIGIVIVFAGTIANAIQVVVEEKLYRNYHVSPFEAMGFFGIFGLTFGIIAYVVLQIVGVEGQTITDVIYILGQGTYEANILIGSSFALMVSICLFNLTGMTVTKLGSSLMRMIVISARTITIWLVEMMIRWSSFDVLVLVGMLLTLSGILVYNYNYLVRRGSWSYDLIVRKPLSCGLTFLKNPDQLIEEEELRLQNIIQMEAKHGPVEA